jgi:hypothetical protein
MDVGNKKHKWIKFMIERDPRVRLAASARKVAYLRLAGPGDLKSKGRFVPKLEAIGKGRNRDMGL